MIILFGIIRCGNKVLMGKRQGLWELPSEILEEDDTMEEALERGFFVRFSLKPKVRGPLMGMNCPENKDLRFLGFVVNFEKRNMSEFRKNGYKWLNLSKLRENRLFPSNVTFVKHLMGVKYS
ncbi:MAG: hypothetical protein HUK21_06965 [Fibrobacteraceae bacterium]|nr:hypothetical protein [Fibrobacteraceae bacterium]